jgi:hypothetical protein
MRLAPILVVLVLLASSCGGGDSASETEATSDSGVETQINDADQTLAEASILRLSDFPTGWREVADDTPDEGADECFKPDLEGVVVTGRAESQSFEHGEVTTATSMAAVYESPEDADTVLAKIADGSLAECVAEYLRDSSDSDVKVKNVEAAKLAFPALGDATDARQVVAELESEGLSPSAFFDMIAVKEGRALSLMMFLDVLSAFDPMEEERLAKDVVGRMATGQ